MKKYLIKWNAGYGENYHADEFKSQEEASEAAYEEWRQDAESSAEYEAVPLTKEIAEDHGLDWDED